jgi:hypothetical protein
MNQHHDDDVLPFDDAASEREWLAQETALRRERLHLDPAGDDARSRRYRLLARTLREPLAGGLPVDFAQQVAARVAASPKRIVRVEVVLAIALVVTLAIVAAAVTVTYGSEWMPSFDAILPAPQAPATRWMLALAGCLGGSWLLGHWQRHAQRREN